MARIGFIKVTFLATLLGIFALGFYHFFFKHEASNCEMVALNKKLQFAKINLERSITNKFPHYSLYYYGVANMKLNQLSGLPILYIPGHGGSYMEVESLGAALQRVVKNLHASFHFDLFALDFAGDLSGFYGPVMMKQTEFAQECIDQILLLYDNDASSKKNKKLYINANNRPETVFVIGYSMGGMVARALYLLAEFDRSSVQSIVTLASPHLYPPITTFDWSMAFFYDDVNKYWSNKVLDEHFFLSVGGGVNDLFVRQSFTRLEKQLQTDNTILSMTTSSPRVWTSLEHGEMISCKSLIYELARSLYDSVDKKTNQFSNSSSFRYAAFQYHFQKNAGPAYQKTNYELMTKVNNSIPWELKEKRSWKFVRSSVSSPFYVVMVISKHQAHKFGFIAITNTDNPSWFGACTINVKETKCLQVGNFARYANLLPPTSSNLKIVTLDGDRLDMFTHWVILVPRSTQNVMMMMEMYNTNKRLHVHNVTTLYDLVVSPRESIQSKVILNSTRPGFLFYNISLNGFTSVLQAYRIKFICNSCLENSTTMDSNFSVMKMHMPWSKEHIYLNVPRGENGEMVLMLSTPAVDPLYRGVHLHMYLMPRCSYQVHISIAWIHSIGQFVRFYAAYLPAYILIQLLMGLSWQLMMLDDLSFSPSFTESHISWAQPYRVGTVAFVVRFILSYTDDENTLGRKLGLPLDDVDIFENMGVWNSAIPLLLYMIAYSFVFFVAWIFSAFFLVASQFFSSLMFGSKERRYKLLNMFQYILLIAGFLSSCFICGSIGIIISTFVFVIRMVTSGAKSLSSPPTKSPVSFATSKFNMSFTIFFILFFSSVINIPSLLQWWLRFSWDSFSLPGDPTRNSGMLIVLASTLFVYSDFPIFDNELLSVAGMISYICCICISLYCTIYTYRLNYFIDAIVLAIATPSFLIYVSRKYRSHCLAPKVENKNVMSSEKAM